MIVLIYFRCFYDTSHGDSSHGAVGGVTDGARVFVCINIISPSLFVIIFACLPEQDVTRRFLACLEPNKRPKFNFFTSDRYIY